MDGILGGPFFMLSPSRWRRPLRATGVLPTERPLGTGSQVGRWKGGKQDVGRRQFSKGGEPYRRYVLAKIRDAYKGWDLCVSARYHTLW